MLHILSVLIVFNCSKETRLKYRQTNRCKQLYVHAYDVHMHSNL